MKVTGLRILNSREYTSGNCTKKIGASAVFSCGYYVQTPVNQVFLSLPADIWSINQLLNLAYSLLLQILKCELQGTSKSLAFHLLWFTCRRKPDRDYGHKVACGCTWKLEIEVALLVKRGWYLKLWLSAIQVCWSGSSQSVLDGWIGL